MGNIKIDLTRCHGHGRCLEEAPQVFGYTDDTNQAFVLITANLIRDKAAIDAAIAACPEAAISRVLPEVSATVEAQSNLTPTHQSDKR